jgi:hypothetical protein
MNRRSVPAAAHFVVDQQIPVDRWSPLPRLEKI